MIKIEIFTSESDIELQDGINNWLSENDVEVITIVQSTAKYSTTISILYKTK